MQTCLLAALRGEVKDCRVLLVRAKVARDVIPNQLCDAGAHVDVIEAYEMEEVARAL